MTKLRGNDVHRGMIRLLRLCGTGGGYVWSERVLKES